jgi:hypothetical protein
MAIAGVFGALLFTQISVTFADPLAGISKNAGLMRSITAITTFADGSTAVKHGQGFVIGDRLFTVYHTLAPRLDRVSPTKREIYVAGTLMTPVYTHAGHDIAIFEIPAAWCEPSCHTWAASTPLALNPDRQVYWVQEAAGERSIVAGRIQHYAWLSASPSAFQAGGEAPCQRNLIVEVDTPFRPGTSGSPVFDTETDAIVGMIQGSLMRAGGDTGYFKPLTCLLPLAQL